MEMKYNFKLLFLFTFLLFAKNNFAQVSAIPYYNINFNNSFFKIAEKDDKSNYYAVNLASFNSVLEKKYFEEITFKETSLIRVDGGNLNIAWFRVKTNHSEEEISNLLLALKNKTLIDVASMSDSEKQEWLNRNGK